MMYDFHFLGTLKKIFETIKVLLQQSIALLHFKTGLSLAFLKSYAIKQVIKLYFM